MVRRKGPRGALAVDADLHLFAVHHVLLDLGDVVGHVVNQFQPQVPGAELEDLLEGLPHPVGDQLPVGKGEIGRRRHGPQVLLRLRRGERGAAELPVRQFDAVLGRGLEHHLDVVVAHLVAQTPGTGMDDGRHLILEEPQGRGQLLIENLQDVAHFDEVVAGAERAQLVLAPVHGELADPLRVGPVNLAVGLDVVQVLLTAEAVFHRPAGPLAHHLFQGGAAELQILPPGAHPRRDVAEQGVDQLLHTARDLAPLEVGAQAAAPRS